MSASGYDARARDALRSFGARLPGRSGPSRRPPGAVSAAEVAVEPMRGAVAMLRRYGIIMSEASMEALEKCPFEWEDTKKLAAAARERLGPYQVEQAARIKQEAQVTSATHSLCEPPSAVRGIDRWSPNTW